MKIERLVFLCSDINEAFSDKHWENFCLSPIRQTRSFIQSRYVLFQNLMIEVLQVTNPAEANDFFFLKEWKVCTSPTFIGTGVKVLNMDKSVLVLKNRGISVKKNFASLSLKYSKGFKHQSCLLDLTWNDKYIYLTEYDENFYLERHQSICTNESKKNNFIVSLPTFSFPNFLKIKLEFDEKERLNIRLRPSFFIQNVEKIEFDWIVFKLQKH